MAVRRVEIILTLLVEYLVNDNWNKNKIKLFKYKTGKELQLFLQILTINCKRNFSVQSAG
jgi:hypothetical protein